MDEVTVSDFVRTLQPHIDSALGLWPSFHVQVQEQASQTDGENSQRPSSHHEHRFNDRLWLNGVARRQLSLRFSQVNQSFNLANATCTHLQNDHLARKKELVELKQQYAFVDPSLTHEFKCHKETEKSLAHERSDLRTGEVDQQFRASEMPEIESSSGNLSARRAF